MFQMPRRFCARVFTLELAMSRYLPNWKYSETNSGSNSVMEMETILFAVVAAF